PDHADVGMVLNNLAMLYHAQGKLQAAEKMYQRAFAIRVKALGQYHPCVITLIDNYANLLRRLNRADDAERIGALARVGSRH
ncbi:MAG TPA: tetratricopeptide repeat protein, partial [Chroococcales cyanobacterium]